MILSASWVIPVSSPPIAEGAVALSGGQIQDVGPAAEVRSRYPDREVRDWRGAALLPGLVNVHSHLELTLLRGYLENLGFWDWIRRLTRTKYELLTREDLGVSALAGACEAIRSGVTTLGDAMDLGVSLDALSASGLRGVLYQEIFSPRAGGSPGAAGGAGGEAGQPGGADRIGERTAPWPCRRPFHPDQPGSFPPCSLQREQTSVSEGRTVGGLQGLAGVHSPGRVRG